MVEPVAELRPTPTVMSARLFFNHRNMFFDQIRTIQFILINFIIISINCTNLETNGTVYLLNNTITTTDATTNVTSLAATTLKMQAKVDPMNPEHPVQFWGDTLKAKHPSLTDLNELVKNRPVRSLSTLTFLEGAMLVFSNLVLIPAILICIRARFRAEAIVYTYTMLYSMLYHICDFAPFRLCIFTFNVMQFADFFASSTAIWCTAILIAPVPSKWVSSLQLSGALTYGPLLTYWKSGLISFLIQAIPPIALVSIFWGLKYYRERRFPDLVYSRNFYAALGLMAFGIIMFMSQDIRDFNRYYGVTHSLWHVSMSLAIALIVFQIERSQDNVGGHWLENLKTRFTSFRNLKSTQESPQISATNQGFTNDDFVLPKQMR